MSTVLVISIGKSARPCLVSAKHHKADKIVFYASQDTQSTASDIERELGLTGELVLLDRDDEFDFPRAYQHARAAIQTALKNRENREVIVDITGGTKIMTAALALAASDHDVRFAYVDGERDPNTGRVIDGSERVRTQMANPLRELRIRELQRLANAWNNNHFREAMDILKDFKQPDLSDADRKFYKRLRDISTAFLAWDLFDYNNAHIILSSALPTFKLLASAKNAAHWIAFADQLSHVQIAHLEPLVQLGERAAPIRVEDLLGNAQRRYQQRRTDDALIRVHRAVVMHAESTLETVGIIVRSGEDTIFPLRYAHLQKDFSHLSGASQILELTERAVPAFRTLNQARRQGGVLSGIFERNNSVLGHGVKPTHPKIVSDLFAALETQFALRAAPPFPLMPQIT